MVVREERGRWLRGCWGSFLYAQLIVVAAWRGFQWPALRVTRYYWPLIANNLHVDLLGPYWKLEKVCLSLSTKYKMSPTPGHIFFKSVMSCDLAEANMLNLISYILFCLVHGHQAFFLPSWKSAFNDYIAEFNGYIKFCVFPWQSGVQMGFARLKQIEAKTWGCWCVWGAGAWDCDMKWMGRGLVERWRGVETHSEEPQVAHCSPAAAPASSPPSSSLPSNRAPLKVCAWVIRGGGGGCRSRSWLCRSVRALRHTDYLLFTWTKVDNASLDHIH